MAGAVACQVVLELHVKHPVHAFDAPMAARCGGEPFDVERRGRNIESSIEFASVCVFGAIDDAKNRMDVESLKLR